MLRAARFSIRFVLLLGLTSSLLVPAWISPARAITVPITMSRTIKGEARKVPTDFAPTHVAFSWRGPERSGVRYRTFSDGDPSRWRRAPEAHDMEYGNHHFSPIISVSRPTAIQWRKRGPKRESMRGITVDYLNTIDGPRRRVVVPATAEAGTGAPDIVTRKQWGADESLKRNCTRDYNRVQQLFVHHTVGTNNDPHPKATMRSIYWYHVVRRGWCDIGYNFVISSDGRVFEGRYARRYGRGEIHDGETKGGRIVTGAHVASYNSGSVGVSLMGNYSQVRPSKKMRTALVKFLAWEARRHGLRPRAEHTYKNPVTGHRRRLPVIAGHRDAGSTECPGNYVYRGLPSIRRDVARLVRRKPSVLTLGSEVESITVGESVDLTGDLKKKDGTPLADRRIVLRRRRAPDGSWRRVDATKTLVDGSFTFTATPRRNGAFKARFPGDRRFRPMQSDRVAIRVHASVLLRAEGGPYFTDGAPVALRGRVRPAHPDHDLVLVIKQRQLTEYETFEKVDLTLDDNSRFAYDFTDGPSGTYRARARFPADSHHARGVSPNIDFVIGSP